MTFAKLVRYFEQIQATSKRLEMAVILGELFGALDAPKEIALVVYLCQGQLRPAFENPEFGMSEKLLQKALVSATGSTEQDVAAAFRASGDYGSVVEQLGRPQRGTAAVQTVYARLADIAAESGGGSVVRKVTLLADLLGCVSPGEAKYIVRIVLGRLRLGVGDPTVLDGLANAFGVDKTERIYLDHAYNRCCDLGLVAQTLAIHGLARIKEFEVVVGCPIRPALAARLSSPEEIMEKIGPCAVEEKYDGFRAQVHKDGSTVKIFSRNLENISAMFPEIVAGTLRQVTAQRAIYEGEAMAYDARTRRYLPFQITVQRKRKHDIAAMQREVPLRIFVFDVLYAEEDLTGLSFRERRRRMNTLFKTSADGVLQISPVREVETAKELNEIFEEAVASGREGIVAKRWDARYQAGGRNFNWIKLKRSYAALLSDTIDAVIIGYYHGKGIRASLGMGSLLVAVYDHREERFKTVAKVGSGWSDEELIRLKEMLEKIRLPASPPGVDSLLEPDEWVEPKYVIEIQADEITKSPVHTCGKSSPQEPGFALRFPRSVHFVRRDKSPRDATTVEEIIHLYSLQGRRG